MRNKINKLAFAMWSISFGIDLIKTATQAQAFNSQDFHVLTMGICLVLYSYSLSYLKDR